MTQQVMTLKDFINQEMKRRDMSMRQFAEFVDVSHTTISRTLDPQEPTNPSIDFLRKLAKATGVSFLSLLALVIPEEEMVDIDTNVRVLAERIARLPEHKREMAETFLLGLLFDTRNE